MAEKILNTPGVNNTPYEVEPFDPPNFRYGGAAVIRMILNSDKVNPPPKVSIPSISDLYTEAEPRNDPSEPDVWNLDPDAVRKTILARDPRGGTRFFEYSYPAAEQIQANGKIIYTIETYEVAPAVLIGGGPQWLCVTGYNNDGGSLNWFKIHDPSFNAGTGAFYTVLANQWNTEYFKPVTGGVRWKDKYVTVCDPDPDRIGLEPSERPIKRSGEVLIPLEDAVELAREGLAESGLERYPQFAEALERSRPMPPILVQSLDREDTYYYIISFNSQEQGKQTTLAGVMVDARFGDLRSAVANPEGFNLIRFSPDDVRRLLTKQKFPLCEQIEAARDRLSAGFYTWLESIRTRDIAPDTLNFMRRTIETELTLMRQPILQPEAIEVRKTLVWKTSPASTNPFQPFYVVTSGLHTLYVRAVDGAIVLDLDCFKPWLLRLGG